MTKTNLLPKSTEAVLLIRIKQLLRIMASGGVLDWIRIPGGPKLFNTKRGVKFAKNHELNGAPDLIILLPNQRVLWCELKAPRGVQQPSQKNFQEKVSRLNHKYYIVRNLLQFQQMLLEHGVNHPILSFSSEESLFHFAGVR